MQKQNNKNALREVLSNINIDNIPAICLVILVILVFLSPSDNDLEFFTLNVLAAVTLALWWIVHLRIKGNGEILKNMIEKHKSLCAVVLIYFLWTVFSISGHRGIEYSMMHAGKLLAFVSVFYIMILTPEAMTTDLFIRTVTLIGIPVIISAVIEYYYYPARIFPWRDARDFFNYFVGNANLLATFTGLLFIGGFLKMIFNDQNKYKTAWLVSLSFSFLVFVMTRSRGGWLALIISIFFLIYIIFRYDKTKILKENKGWIASLLIICSLITIIYSIPSPINKNRYQIAERMEDAVTLSDVSTNARLLIWRVAGEMIMAHPFKGVGYGRFPLEYPVFRKGLILVDPDISGIGPNRLPIAVKEKYAHNEVLHIAAESGLIGLLIFILILGIVIIPFIRLIRHRLCADRIIEISFIASCLVLFLTHSLVDFTLYSCTNGLLFWMMLGLMVNQKE